jgi:hypothetical protein
METGEVGRTWPLVPPDGNCEREGDAADILYALGSPETYRLLTADRGWSPHRFERWYADAMARLLFGLH